MMTLYVPAGFGPSSVLGPHEGLRVTFAETRSMLTPDAVEAADLRDNIAHMVDEMESGGYALAPASDVTVAPGELAATMDFVVVTPGSLTVAEAVTAIEGALYGPLDFLRRTYIRRVEHLGDHNIGQPIPTDLSDADAETSPLAVLAGVGGVGLVVAAVAALFVFAPEIKLALRAKR